eukprot:GFUD01004623.1.p1 GENE.GFUD01004623.1~~GFUD01004623.1.p1  ORF type:complete len:186 (-),score=16.98 GFUD01004623.1:170-727(-)
MDCRKIFLIACMWTSVLCSWESAVLSEVCKDGAGTNQQRATAARDALKPFDGWLTSYLWMVVVTDHNAGWASNGHSKSWNNTCGKDIVVWWVKTHETGNVCSEVLREGTNLIINRETNGTFVTETDSRYSTARDNIKIRLDNAGVNHDGFVVYDPSKGAHAAMVHATCFLVQEVNGKKIVIFLDN